MIFIAASAKYCVLNPFFFFWKKKKQLVNRKPSTLKKNPTSTEITTYTYQLNYENIVEKKIF